ncbi:hypothetical protein NQ318_020008, partial [Aromia moschata]
SDDDDLETKAGVKNKSELLQQLLKPERDIEDKKNDLQSQDDTLLRSLGFPPSSPSGDRSRKRPNDDKDDSPNKRSSDGSQLGDKLEVFLLEAVVLQVKCANPIRLLNNTVAPNVSLQRSSSVPEPQLSPGYGAAQLGQQGQRVGGQQQQQPYSPHGQLQSPLGQQSFAQQQAAPAGYQNPGARLSPQAQFNAQLSPRQAYPQAAAQNANWQQAQARMSVQQNPMLTAQLTVSSSQASRNGYAAHHSLVINHQPPLAIAYDDYTLSAQLDLNSNRIGSGGDYPTNVPQEQLMRQYAPDAPPPHFLPDFQAGVTLFSPGGSDDGPPKEPTLTKAERKAMEAYRFDSTALERAAQAARELEKSSNNLAAELKAKAKIDRENRDLTLEQIRLKAEENRITVLESIKTAGSVIGTERKRSSPTGTRS